MTSEILHALYERGPMTMAEIAEAVGADAEALCDPLASLILNSDVHLESDQTFWFSVEAAA